MTIEAKIDKKTEIKPFSDQILFMKQKTIVYSETSFEKLRICRFQNTLHFYHILIIVFRLVVLYSCVILANSPVGPKKG